MIKLAEDNRNLQSICTKKDLHRDNYKSSKRETDDVAGEFPLGQDASEYLLKIRR